MSSLTYTFVKHLLFDNPFENNDDFSLFYQFTLYRFERVNCRPWLHTTSPYFDSTTSYIPDIYETVSNRYSESTVLVCKECLSPRSVITPFSFFLLLILKN